MKTIAISTREFRDNQRKYFDLADASERVIIQRGRDKAYVILPLEYADDTEYLLSTEANRKHLIKSISEAAEGESKQIALGDIWK